MAEIFEDFVNLLHLDYLSDVHFQEDKEKIKKALRTLEECGEYTEEEMEKLRKYVL